MTVTRGKDSEDTPWVLETFDDETYLTIVDFKFIQWNTPEEFGKFVYMLQQHRGKI